MAIHEIGSRSQTALESSTNRHSTEIQNAKIAYDSAHSSIVSLSQAQEDGGVGDFFYSLGSGVWSIATWPFRAIGSLWSWMTGSVSSDVVNEKDDDEKGGGSKSSKGGGKRTEASADFVEFFKTAKEDAEFELVEFKKAFKALSSEEKKSYENLLWKAGGFQTTTGSKTWAKKEIENPKKDYTKETQKLMQQAAEQYKAMPDVKKIGERYAKLAEKELKSLDDDDNDADFKDDKRSIKKAYGRLPDEVKNEVNECAAYYAPHPTFAVVSKKDKDKWDERKEFLATKGKAHVMQTFAKNSMLFVSDPAAREDIETMVRVIGQAITSVDAPFGLTESNFANAYKNMSTKTAKQAYAQIVGYAIGRPDDGDKYISGKLKIDAGKKVAAPEVSLLGRKLAELAVHDGITVGRNFGVFFPKEGEEEGHGRRDDDSKVDKRRGKRNLEEGELHRGELEDEVDHGEPLGEDGQPLRAGRGERKRSSRVNEGEEKEFNESSEVEGSQDGNVTGDEGEEEEEVEGGEGDVHHEIPQGNQDAGGAAVPNSRAAAMNRWKNNLKNAQQN